MIFAKEVRGYHGMIYPSGLFILPRGQRALTPTEENLSWGFAARTPICLNPPQIFTVGIAAEITVLAFNFKMLYVTNCPLEASREKVNSKMQLAYKPFKLLE